MNNLITWVEIPSTNIERAIKFYNSILDLDLELLDFGTEKMACLPNNEGAIIHAEGYTPSANGVLVSFNTGNYLDATIDKIKSNGGEILKGKTKIEAEGRGYFAIFKDCEGNRLGLYGDK